MAQWHPIFAKLLRPLLEEHYEVLTNVPVGDVPRSADILVVRRTHTAPAPFQGIWRWLTGWNIFEFKGPTVSARTRDLDLLIELGLGIHRRLQGDRRKLGQEEIARSDVSFWYIVSHMGHEFVAQAEALLGPLECVANGVRRVGHLGRTIYLVASSEVDVERDSIPLHLMANEPKQALRRLVDEVAAHPDLFAVYGAWLAVLFPGMRKEIREMAQKTGSGLVLDLKPLIYELGVKEVMRQLGLKEVIEEIGLKEVINEVGLKEVINEVGLKEVINEVGLKEVINEIGLKEVINEVGLKEVINEVGLKEVINEIGLEEILGHLSQRQRRELRRRLEEGNG